MVFNEGRKSIAAGDDDQTMGVKFAAFVETLRSGYGSEVCLVCDGTGKHKITISPPPNFRTGISVCYLCEGSGKITKEELERVRKQSMPSE